MQSNKQHSLKTQEASPNAYQLHIKHLDMAAAKSDESLCNQRHIIADSNMCTDLVHRNHIFARHFVTLVASSLHAKQRSLTKGVCIWSDLLQILFVCFGVYTAAERVVAVSQLLDFLSHCVHRLLHCRALHCL